MGLFFNTCDNCRRWIPRSATFCRYCGGPNDSGWVKCWSCGAQISPASKHCHKCGVDQKDQRAVDLTDGRWPRQDEDIALKVETSDLRGFIKKELDIEQGRRLRPRDYRGDRRPQDLRRRGRERNLQSDVAPHRRRELLREPLQGAKVAQASRVRRAHLRRAPRGAQRRGRGQDARGGLRGARLQGRYRAGPAQSRRPGRRALRDEPRAACVHRLLPTTRRSRTRRASSPRPSGRATSIWRSSGSPSASAAR